jgi:hypothetical protein
MKIAYNAGVYDGLGVGALVKSRASRDDKRDQFQAVSRYQFR